MAKPATVAMAVSIAPRDYFCGSCSEHHEQLVSPESWPAHPALRRDLGTIRDRDRHAARFSLRPSLEFLENRLTLTGNIVATSASLVSTTDQPLSAWRRRAR